jgi:hypothetical protein
MARDVELVKAAMLYADEVELISIAGQMLGGVAQLSAGPAELLSLMAALDDDTLAGSGGASLPPNWRDALPALTAILESDPGALAGTPLAGLSEGFASGPMADMRDVVDGLMQSSGAAELAPAFDAGIVRLGEAGLSESADSPEPIDRWRRILERLLRDPSRALVLDDEVADMVRLMVAEGLVPSPSVRRGSSEAQVGAGLIARLPAFPDAPVDELMDLRRDLANPLTRYRSAVARMSRSLAVETFSGPMDNELNALWHSDVAPALVEIEDQMSDHGLVREVARTMATDSRTLVVEGAALFLGLTSHSSLSALVSGATAIGAPAVQAIITGAVDAAQGNRSVERHDLYYLYAVEKRLS